MQQRKPKGSHRQVEKCTGKAVYNMSAILERIEVGRQFLVVTPSHGQSLRKVVRF